MKSRPHKAKRILFTLVRILLLLCLLPPLGIYFFQEYLLFHPEPLPETYTFAEFPAATERWLDLNGEHIDSLLFRVPNARGTILYFHGNAGSLAEWGQVADRLAGRSHWNVWILDYPGFGKSTGKITSEEQLFELAESFWKLAQAEFPAAKLVLFGRSIGSGLAVKLAADHSPSGLILESPYLSMTSLAKLKFPWLPSFILRYPLPSDTWIGAFGGPTLLFHGTQDELIPFEQGKALAGLAKYATFVPIEGGHHNDLGEQPLFWNKLLPWLDAIGSRP